MSKNGMRIFKNFDPYITSPFGNRVSPINGSNEFHEAVDYGTNNLNLAQYALENGKVLSAGTDGLGGKFVYVLYPRLGYVGLHYHLANINVKTGQNVDNNTIIGLTGQTGMATGVHLHYGWFKESEYNKSYYDRKWENFEEYNFSNSIGTPVSPSDKPQLEVIIPNLRGRKTPNGQIYGLLTMGRYNILDKKYDGDYLWYKIGDDLWCAYENDWINLYNYYPFEVKSKVNLIRDILVSSTAGYSNSIFSKIKKGKYKIYGYHTKNGLYMALTDLKDNILSPAAWTKEFDAFKEEK